jgi:lipopolysaccharide transport system ATP-binding protein
MVRSPAVAAEGISKLYRLGEYKAGYETLRDTVAGAARRVRRRERRHDPSSELWALDDVSFEVEAGEVVGFIGHNGAGKSTLLKILTRITPPTRGRATIRGRVGSILEVGTGFHPELTGRENVLLNGAVLGMSRREVLSKFDEIVEFSGIGQFIDTPVKRYSSGMYVRLAFAVAAHLEPEVLIIDEVLAVGDHEFQQRCMGRIEDISGSGRTVLFVSHDMQAVSRLCDRAYWLEKGRVVLDGPSESVVAQYLQGRSGSGAERVWPVGEGPGSARGRIVRTRIVDADGHTRNAVDVRERVGIEIDWAVEEPSAVPIFPKIKLTNQRGEVIFNALDTDERWHGIASPGRYVSTAWIPSHLLNEGFVSVDVAIVSLGMPKLANVVNIPAVISFHVQDVGDDGASSKGRYTGQVKGVVRPLLEWTTVASAASAPHVGATAIAPRSS